MRLFLAHARGRGLPIKWFGSDRQLGFTSTPRHWAYAGEQDALDATHSVLSTLCDIRTPVAMTDEECDLTATIVREAIDAALAAVPEGNEADRVPQTRCKEKH
jgi:hypothetical protein